MPSPIPTTLPSSKRFQDIFEREVGTTGIGQEVRVSFEFGPRYDTPVEAIAIRHERIRMGCKLVGTLETLKLESTVYPFLPSMDYNHG